MEPKYKTKDQKKIERLEEKLAEKEAELSQVKKDRKRLNYAVERLERENERLLDKVSSMTLQPTSPTPISATPDETQQPIKKEEDFKKYALRICWRVGQAPEWFIKKMDEAIQVGCLPKIGEEDFDNFYEIEKTAFYLYEGTKREFLAVKRMITATSLALIPLNKRDFDYLIAGGEISDYKLEELSNKH